MASSSQSWNYDVFLSFRGEDTRKTFVDHLYSALKDSKISTYKDDEALPRGDSIRPSLLKAIEGAQIALVIFSQNYADSSWCLDELAHIMKCRDERNLIVMPIFYDVDPSEVRKQKRKYGEAFAEHEVENVSKAQSWINALDGASEIAGWEPKNIANGHEAEGIKVIVDKISEKLFSLTSDLDEDLVGMSDRLRELEEHLEIGSPGVRMVGIWGIGGGGKTTLASSLYMTMSHHFQGHYIVDNIREEASKHGLKALQKKFLSRISKNQTESESVEVGKTMIRKRLKRSNVLILLDDVDDIEQLEALAGSHDWFGSGSRIVITTRDEHLLITHRVDKVCRVRLLSNEEALRLFNKKAYNKNNPVNDYKQLSSRVVSYAAGLPLALKVLGSFLYDKDEKEWKSSLARLENNPEMKIVEKLKISYDGLKIVEKDLFLDIACFYRGWSTKDAWDTFEACGYHPDVGLKVLRQKSLVTIVDGKFDMHDIIQEMGHYIVRGEHPNNPEKHSRVWKAVEIDDICKRDATMENDKVKAMQYIGDYGSSSQFCKLVSNMKELRWIYVGVPSGNYKDVASMGPTFLSNELQLIHWYRCPGTPFPKGFEPTKLGVLKLVGTSHRELWNDKKYLPNLKVLALHGLTKLLSTPDFDQLPRLQKLTLSGCYELEEIHSSLGHNTSLEYISVTDCDRLRKFPTVHQMANLKTLEIKRCNDSLKFPEIKSDMTSLVELSLEKVVLDDLLPSIEERCLKLTSLNFTDCYNDMNIEVNFDVFKHMQKLTLYKFNCMKMGLPGACGLENEKKPIDIIQSSNLQELKITYNDFTGRDFSLSHLTRLELLNLSGCKQLVELPELPSSIVILKADCCDVLKAVGDSLKNCKRLLEISLLGGSVINDACKLLQSMLQRKEIQNHFMVLHLRGVEIAKSFKPHLIKRDRCRVGLPENWCNDFCGFLICVVLKGFYTNSMSMRMIMKQAYNVNDCISDVVWEESDSDDEKNCTFVWYVSFGSLRHTKWWNEIYKFKAVSFDITRKVETEFCSGFRVRLVKKSERGPIDTSTEEYEFSRDTPNLKFETDSPFALEFCLNCVDTHL